MIGATKVCRLSTENACSGKVICGLSFLRLDAVCGRRGLERALALLLGGNGSAGRGRRRARAPIACAGGALARGAGGAQLVPARPGRVENSAHDRPALDGSRVEARQHAATALDRNFRAVDEKLAIDRLGGRSRDCPIPASRVDVWSSWPLRFSSPPEPWPAPRVTRRIVLMIQGDRRVLPHAELRRRTEPHVARLPIGHCWRWPREITSMCLAVARAVSRRSRAVRAEPRGPAVCSR